MFTSIGYSDEVSIQEFDSTTTGGFSENFRTRMNKQTEVFVKNCDNPSPPLSDPKKWCKIPPSWNSNPGDAQDGRTPTEIWQATGRCAKGYKFNATILQCVSSAKTACTWGQKYNPDENTCDNISENDNASPSCEIYGFNTEENESGLWLNKTVPSSLKRIYAYVTCKSKTEKSFIPICNVKNISNNTQTNWYKCGGPDPLTQNSIWIEINLSEISKDDKDNQIVFEIRGAYSKTPLRFHESTSKSFLYKI
jgi:hypothetical protein